MERIGGETVALYADLRERLEIFEAMRTVASLKGEFTTKTIKDITYHYFQATLAGGRVQFYLGPDSADVRRLVADRKAGKQQVFVDEGLFQRLGSQILAGGVAAVPTDMSRVIRRLADSGVFKLGGTLVGTVAFQILGTHYGVRWDSASHTTQDIDLATDNRVLVAVPQVQADVPEVIDSLKMGFFPVPRLSHKEPSTSYAIRGKTLRIDFLTPMKGSRTTPVFMPRFNAAAQPLKYLDYLIEDPQSAVMVNAAMPCLVKVPQPARFALHKLIVSSERSFTSADKSRKDATQASMMLEMLKAERPADIETAKKALEKYGASWFKKMMAAAKRAKIEV